MKSKILLIDDEEGIRFTIKRFLSNEGHEVLTAKDYASAIDKISNDKFDLIFVDIVLKDHSGVDILSFAKKQGIKCPIVMITGFPNMETATETLRLGAFDYLAKPITKDQILRVATTALRYKHALDQKALAEAKQERHRHHLEAIFKSVTDAIITVDREMRITGVNEATRNICGRKPEEIIGLLFQDAFSHCDRKCQRALEHILDTKQDVLQEKIICGCQYASHQVVELTGTKLQDLEDNFLGAVLVVKDKTRLAELERELGERNSFNKIIGKDKKMRDIYHLIENISDMEATVLIRGESGTGKELVAEAIHYRGRRSSKPLVKVNCSTLPVSLLESELFGHVKGAFTGATRDRIGRFEMAEGGTIFLDEINDVPSNIQMKLLRVLEEKTFERVGDSNPITADIRIIASTNTDLKDKIKSGEFRKDLYYRLRILEIKLPLLNERRQDIPLLIDHFMNLFRQSYKKEIIGLTHDAVKVLMDYPWPGNVRELKHAIEHAFIVCSEGKITPSHLPSEIVSYAAENIKILSKKPNLSPEVVLDTLEKTDWNKSEASRRLGVSRQTIYRKLRNIQGHPPPAKS